MDRAAMDDAIVRLAQANEAERLADELDRRGGGFTAHAAALARQRAGIEKDRLRREMDDRLGGR